MNIKQIKYFVEAVQQGSLSAGAKEQFVTVQAVSKAIADLEDELGRTLLVRGSRGVQPTPFGLIFHQKALRALESFEELEAFGALYQAQSTLPDLLRLGLNTPPFIGNEWVRENIASFVKSQLGIEAQVDLMLADEGFEALRQGRLDALITVGAFRHPDVVCNTVGTIMPAVLMNRAHPLAVKDSVALSDIAPYPVAVPGWFSEFNDTIVSLYREQHPQLRYVELQIDDISRHIADNGVFLTTGLMVLEKMMPELTLRFLTAEEALAVPICFVNMKDKPSPTLLMLRKLVYDWLAVINRGKGLAE